MALILTTDMRSGARPMHTLEPRRADRRWILDESPGTYRWGQIELPPPDRRRGADPGRGERPQPHGPVGHPRAAEAAAAPRPGLRRRRRGRGDRSDVDGVAVGDEVVVNPGVSPIADIVALGNDSPMGPGFAIYGEHMWGGHATHAVAPARNVVRRPAGAAGRSARPTRWRR